MRRAGPSNHAVVVTGIGHFFSTNPIAAVLAAGEIGFWVLIAAGLIARYPLRRPRIGAILLLGVPVLDVVVLLAAVADLARGAQPNALHGLAALYLGFSVVFGPGLVRWADVRFAHRFADGPPPQPKATGRAKAVQEWREWGKCLAASAISAVLLGAAILVVGPSSDNASPLWGWLGRLGVIIVIWFVTGPLWHLEDTASAER